MPNLTDLIKTVEKYHPNPDLSLIEKAYHFAEKAHAGQVRASGEPFFNHLVETSLIVCQLKLDIPSIAAALLHDTIEDCAVTIDQLKENFGTEIAEIVEGVTNLTRLEFESKEEKQSESFRKMLLAMARDIRVVLLKLCDRLHNMRTLEYVAEEKRRRKANETKEIYAPLANRLGLNWLKSELEDLCFKYLRPELYTQVSERFIKNKEEREQYILKTTTEIVRLLEEAGVSASVKGRAKHFYSIWQKMESNNLSFDEVHDVLGFRIIVPTLRACYECLGITHAHWKPVPGRFKDYIAMPKPNMYQSLHTTVIGPEGRRIEIQIRTPEMHKIAEEGIAAHWRYKEGEASAESFDLQWVKELVETQQYLKNPDEFIQSVKSELFPEDVFVFTPKGDLIRLPRGSTPIDFAYAIHTDVGHNTIGGKVNGLIVPLSYVLRNGDTVEVSTQRTHTPSKDWLNFVKSTKAKQRIRAFLKSEEHSHSMAIGMEILTKDLRKVKLSFKKLEKEGKLTQVAEHMGLKSEGDLFAEIGYGKISSSKVIAKLLPEGIDVEGKLAAQPSPLRRIFERAAKSTRQKIGVVVSGIDDILVRFAKCCEPLPGDRIVGFISRGRGVTIHRADCNHILELDPQRKVPVRWDNEIKGQRRVHLTVHSQDQRGILAKVSKIITDQGGDIKTAQIRTTEYQKALIAFELLIEDALQLKGIIRGIEMIPGVIKVERTKTIDK
jgi:guanosine-3',5'-bis(diphosphate) 3'-pyrophosphohydrolase